MLLDEPDLTVVTGAGGWFGRAFLSAMASGAPEVVGPAVRAGTVRALAGSPEEVELIFQALPRAEVHVGDVADESVLKRLLADGRGASVIHAAGVIHPQHVSDFDRVNVGGTRAVLQAAERAGARRLVHLSSNSAFGTNPDPSDAFRSNEPFDPYMAYGRSKMTAELLVRSSTALDTVVVRPPWFYGPFQPLRQSTFLTMVRRGRFPLLGPGQQRRSMVYVDNLVQGVALAERVPEAAGQAFWITDNRPYPMLEVVQTVKQALREEGFDVAERQVRLPALAGRIAERVDGALQTRGKYHQQIHVLGEMDKTIACDVSYARDVLGYRPHVSLLEGMRRTVRWCVENGVTI
jgi:nucleoside-diphosphate-sugar epimerase